MICFICCTNLSAQLPTTAWAVNMGISGTISEGYSIIADNNGNVYTTGGFEGSFVDFNPGAGNFSLSSNSGSEDMFIQKLDANGNFLWAKRVGGNMLDRGLSMAFDLSGNIYALGYFKGTVDLDPGPGTYNLTSQAGGAHSMFILKLSSSGNFIWAKMIENSSYTDELQCILTDDTGNIYLASHCGDYGDFDPGPGTYYITGSGGYDILIEKLDSSGNFLWAKNIGGAGYDAARSMKMDSLGNLYLTGRFQNTVDFDPGAGVYNLSAPGSSHHIFVLKLDNSGNFIWAKNVGGPSTVDVGNSIEVDPLGNITVVGECINTSDFDPGPGTYNLTSNGYDMFLLKLDLLGNFISAAIQGGVNNDYAFASTMDDAGNIYVTGEFIGTVDFDPGPGIFNLTTSGAPHTFVQKLDISGSLIWAFKIGNVNTTGGFGIFIDTTNIMYLTGRLAGPSVDFDPGPSTFNLNGHGGLDIFSAKFNQCSGPAQPSPIVGNNTVCAGSSQTYSITNDPGASSYTWNLPAGWTGSSTTNSINVIAGSSGGTISVAANSCGASIPQTLNVTVIPNTSSTQTISACTSYLWPVNGNSYFSSGVYNDTISNIGGCDSMITLNLTIRNNTSSSQSVTTCDNYTWPVNGNNYTSSGTYNATIPNFAGCDSVITLNLTINNSTSSSQNVTVCNNYTWPVNGNNYTSSGSYNTTIPNASGCDSVITLNLTINNSTSSSQSATACNNYTWLVNGNNYTSSGSYNATVANSLGCDSVITLNLTINNNTSSTINASDCESYISPSGIYTWTTSGNHMDTIPNSNGCDSIITVMLTIHGLPSVSYSETTTPACVYWTPFSLTTGTPIGGTYSGTGVTANSFDPSIAGTGNHAVVYQYTDGNNCSNTDTSFIQVNACLGIEEGSNDPIILFPNPNDGNFTVAVPGTESCLIKIYDFTGKLVMTDQLLVGNNHVNLNARCGMYFVHIFTLANEETVIKLVIW